MIEGDMSSGTKSIYSVRMILGAAECLGHSLESVVLLASKGVAICAPLSSSRPLVDCVRMKVKIYASGFQISYGAGPLSISI